MRIDGLPAGTAAWRHHVAVSAAGLTVGDGVDLAFDLPLTKWVDLDTIVESTLAGLRNGGVVPARFAGVDAIVARRADALQPGVVVRGVAAGALVRRRPPGAAQMVATTEALPRDRDSKRAWRDTIAAAWGDRPLLAEPVWADVVFVGSRSLLGALEPALDALEPVLGRDPRGRSWQEFFPNDHIIRWLRVRRHSEGPQLTLQLGAFD